MTVLLKDLEPGEAFTFSGAVYVRIHEGVWTKKPAFGEKNRVFALRILGSRSMGKAWEVAYFGAADTVEVERYEA